MTEYQYIKSKMNAWDHYGATFAFVIPVLSILGMVIAAMYVPEEQWNLQNNGLRLIMLIFLLSLGLLIFARSMWSRKQGRLKDKFAQLEQKLKDYESTG